MFSRPSSTSSTMLAQASATRVCIAQPVQNGAVRRQKDEPVGPMPGLAAVSSQVLDCSVGRLVRVFFDECMLGREHHESHARCRRVRRHAG